MVFEHLFQIPNKYDEGGLIQQNDETYLYIPYGCYRHVLPGDLVQYELTDQLLQYDEKIIGFYGVINK